MDGKSIMLLIGGFFCFFILFIFVFLLIIFKIAKKETKRQEEIKLNTPKHRFEYVDFFFYHIYYGGTKADIRTYGYFVIRDIDTSILYAIHNRNVNVSFNFVSLFNNKKMDLFLNTSPRKEISFNDKGDFWISSTLNDGYYMKDGDCVRIGDENFKYGGCIEKTDRIDGYNILYNLNSNYDISIFDNVLFINGIVKFDIDN